MRAEAAALVREAVLGASSVYSSRPCALMELARSMGDTGSLLRLAIRVGLTPSEAVGIMDGWDLRDGKWAAWMEATTIKGDDASYPMVASEYEAGRLLATTLYNERYGAPT